MSNGKIAEAKCGGTVTPMTSLGLLYRLCSAKVAMWLRDVENYRGDWSVEGCLHCEPCCSERARDVQLSAPSLTS